MSFDSYNARKGFRFLKASWELLTLIQSIQMVKSLVKLVFCIENGESSGEDMPKIGYAMKKYVAPNLDVQLGEGRNLSTTDF